MPTPSNSPSEGTDSWVEPGLAAAFAAPSRPLEAPPEQLGPYRIHGLLGEGGMGRVYDASEEFPARRVALKVLRPGMATTQLIQRFEREAQLLGRLQHPGIAKVFAAGTLETEHEPVPYLAMERIDGEPLDHWLDRNQPSRRERIELVALIADAIHHAHIKGVVHRDLKPANVLVDRDGRPKVVDFGIACAVGQDTIQGLRTAAGQLLGTLPYMAPEQVAGDEDPIDARADVYGLGCILYRTLSGGLPLELDGGNLATAVRLILERAPTPLGTQDSTLRGDLEVIAGKALEKEPEQRYDSAAALAEDLRRHLRFEPILARPTTAVYQLSRFARRHRLPFGLAVGLLLALVGGLAGTLVYAERATERQQQAEAERDHKALVASILLANLANTSPFHKGANMRAVDNLREIERQLTAGATDAEVEVPLRMGLVRGFRELELFDEAGANLARVTELLGDDDGPTALAAEVEACRLRMGQDELESARPRLAAAFERALVLHGPDHRETLAIEGDILRCTMVLERSDEAVEQSLDLLERARTLFGERDPEVVSLLALVSSTHGYAGRLPDAGEYARQRLELCIQLYGPLHGLTLSAQTNYAAILSWLGRVDESTPLLEATLHDAERTFGEDSWVLRQLMQAIGENHSNAGRYDQAADALAQAATLNAATLGPAHSETLMCRDQLAIAQRRAGRGEEALIEFQAVRELREQALGADHPDLGGSWTAIAITQRILGDHDASLASFELARANGMANFERGHDLNLWTDTAMARLLILMDSHDEAADLMGEVVPLRAELVGEKDPTYLMELELLGDACLAADRHADATAAYEACLAIRTDSLELRWKLAGCHDAAGDTGAEIVLLRELEHLFDEPTNDQMDLAALVDARLEELRASP